MPGLEPAEVRSDRGNWMCLWEGTHFRATALYELQYVQSVVCSCIVKVVHVRLVIILEKSADGALIQ